MMSSNSKIEWTEATWNPVTGCTKVSQGCKHCYAERLWPRIVGAESARNGPGFKGLRGMARPFTDVRCHPERLDAPLHWKKPRMIFVNSMSDLFHENVPDEFILQVFDIMRQCENGFSGRLGRSVSQHTFQILTKRPERMRDFCTRLRFAQNDERGLYLAKKLPHNGYNPMRALHHVWLGVSVEDQATADERIPLLLQTPAAVRFLSCEPLLGPIDLRRLHYDGMTNIDALTGAHGVVLPLQGRGDKIGWVIAGGESGPKARPSHPDWFRSLRDQCAPAGVPFFFKQWGEWAPSGSGQSFVCACGDHTQRLEAGWHQHCRAGHSCIARVGKKAAGRLLDGREHMEYPA